MLECYPINALVVVNCQDFLVTNCKQQINLTLNARCFKINIVSYINKESIFNNKKYCEENQLSIYKGKK